jgi:putative ABC transport system ATP-binding protein
MIDYASKPGIACRELIKDYGTGESRIRALRGVTVDIHPAELTLLVGPSGCGKTTLISILAATLDATEGEVSVLGIPLNGLSKVEKTSFRANNVGFVFQQFNLLPALTAAENVAVPLVIRGQSRADATQRARTILSAVGLDDRADALPAKLSGGQPSAIDAHTGQTIMTLIRQLALAPERVTVVVTHDARVFTYADRIIKLEDGRVTDDQYQHAQT